MTWTKNSNGAGDPASYSITAAINMALYCHFIYNRSVKTTVDIPAATYNRARSLAAARGVSFRRFLIEALEEKLQSGRERPWMDAFGLMSAEPEAVYEVDQRVEQDLSTVDPEEWQ